MLYSTSIINPQNAMRALVIALLFLTASCSKKTGGSHSSNGQIVPSLEMVLPGVDGFIHKDTLNNYEVSGKCSDGSRVIVVIDGEEKSVDCLNGEFQITYDLTSKADGELDLIVKVIDQKNQEVTIEEKITKDTTPPSQMLVFSGLGASVTNDQLPRTVTIASSEDDYYYKVSHIVNGLCSAVDWDGITHSTLATYNIALVANSDNSLCVLSADKSLNWRVAPVEASVYLDTVDPRLNFVQARVASTSAQQVTLNWTLTEKKPSNLVPMVLEYSVDNESSWVEIDSRLVGTAELNNVAYSAIWTTINGNHHGVFRLRYSDLAGNDVEAKIPFFIDNESPELDSIILADGAGLVALPAIRVQTNVTVKTAPIAKMRISENSDLSGISWLDYQDGDRSFTLSTVGNINKVVYVQVQSLTGQVSNIVSAGIILDYGTVPEIKVTSPVAGTYLPGATLNIEWECSTTSTVGLAANPIKEISYTIDDGISYFKIAEDLPNSESATVGKYDWVIPAQTPTGQAITSTTPLRILINCITASGIMMNGQSELLNSSWGILVGEPGNLAEGVHSSAVEIRSRSGRVFSDSAGSFYYTRENAIMKIDGKSGNVSTFFGNRITSGCSFSGASGFFSFPLLWDITNDEMLIYSRECSRLYKVDINTKNIIWSRSLDIYIYNSNAGVSYNKSGYLYFIGVLPSGERDNILYSVDLNSLASTPQRIIGLPGVCGSVLPVGSDAQDSQFLCSNAEANVSPDRQKIWINNPDNPQTIYLERNEEGRYIISTTSLVTPFSRCVETDFDKEHLYCNGMNIGVAGEKIIKFNVNDETRLELDLISFKEASEAVTQTTLGTGKNSIFAYLTSNEVFNISHEDGQWNVFKAAGKSFHTYGNGTDSSKAAFTQLGDMVYDSWNDRLYLRGTNHLRRLNLDLTIPTAPLISSVETGFGSIPNSTPIYGLAISVGGNHIVSTGVSRDYFRWWSNNLTTWDSLNMTVATGNAFYNPPSSDASRLGYPTVLENTFLSSSGYLTKSHEHQMGTFLSNDKFYYVGSSDRTKEENDLWIFESDAFQTLSANRIVRPVVGALGAVGYDSNDDGNLAFGARLTRINGMQPILNTPSADYGDMLVFDGQYLRRISLVSESANPRIYTLIDFETFANYPGHKKWDHAVYDEDTGWSYFAISDNQLEGREAEVWAAKSGVGFTKISTEGIALSGNLAVENARQLKLVVIPGSKLLMLDRAKSRVLQTSLMP